MDETKQSPMYVAVVDDETDLLYLFKDALTQLDNIAVLTFSDPQLAVEHFQLNHRNYGVVVADYRMPIINGIEMLEKMKGINPAVARILVSAFEVSDEVFKNCRCVDKFLQKPISMVELVDEVKASLKAFEEASKTD